MGMGMGGRKGDSHHLLELKTYAEEVDSEERLAAMMVVALRKGGERGLLKVTEREDNKYSAGG